MKAPGRPSKLDSQSRPGESAPQKAIRAAREQATASERAVQSLSARKLANLLKLPPSERLKHQDDPDLTRADRAKLQESVIGALRLKRADEWSDKAPGWLWRAWGRSRLRAPMALKLIAASVLAAAPTATAWRNTGHNLSLLEPATIEFRWPDGDKRAVSLSRGDRVTIVRGWFGSYARAWIPAGGYAYAPANSLIMQ
jgi:hypothetical protein